MSNHHTTGLRGKALGYVYYCEYCLKKEKRVLSDPYAVEAIYVHDWVRTSEVRRYVSQRYVHGSLGSRPKADSFQKKILSFYPFPLSSSGRPAFGQKEMITNQPR
jgi:hypothetical protein